MSRSGGIDTITPLDLGFDVKTYGAKGDGVHDDTAAILAAINAMPVVNYFDGNSNFNTTGASVTGRAGTLIFPPGIYLTSNVITLPPGVIRILGAGQQMWGGPGNATWGYLTQLGGSVIACNAPNNGVFTIAASPAGYPATVLFVDGIEVRALSPATAQSGAAPIIAFDNMIGGVVRNLTVQEVKSSGGQGNNLHYVFSSRPNIDVTERVFDNITAFGGDRAFAVSGAHTRVRSISAGGTSGAGVDGSFNRAFEIGLAHEQTLEVLHAYSSAYGFAFTPYPFSTPTFTNVVRALHFEACAHYLLPLQTSQSVVVVLDNPCWNVAALSPQADVAASIAGPNLPSISGQTGYFILSRNELNPRSLSGFRLLLPGATGSSWTAGVSPYTFGPLGYDANFVITTVGGMTALTLDGQAVPMTANTIIPVQAGHSLIATWATTAPVFKVLPV